MAGIGDIEIVDLESGFDSGTAFLLKKPNTESCAILFGSDSVVQTSEGNPYVVARMKGSLTCEEALSKGLEFVQKALDVLSITGKIDLSTQIESEEHIVWWPDKKSVHRVDRRQRRQCK